MDKSKLQIIRGTGLPIDGVVCSILNEGDEDGYVFVAPYNNDQTYAEKSIKVNRKYLQPINVREEYSYSFNITQLKVRKDGTREVVSSHQLFVGPTLKKVSTGSIVRFLEANLSPILKME